jgi:hypothetical protein
LTLYPVIDLKAVVEDRGVVFGLKVSGVVTVTG